jgi:hypothetical protein
MSPEEHELLKRSIALAEENNDMLRSIRSSMRLARFMTIVYWLIIIGISLGAYYFAKPYLEKAWNLYNSAQTNIAGVGKVLDSLK